MHTSREIAALIRAGGRAHELIRPYSHEGIEEIQVPFLCTSLSPNTFLDWNYTTTAQAGLNNRVIPYPRGRLLGGSSSTSELFVSSNSDRS